MLFLSFLPAFYLLRKNIKSPFSTAIMRFNIALLCAFLGAATQLVAGTQPAAANPKLKWNSPETQGGVMFVGANCALGVYICDATGKPLTEMVLAGTVYCCGVSASAIVASRGPHWEKAAKALGARSKVVYDASRRAMTNSGTFMTTCPGRVCRMVQMSKVTGAVVTGAIKGVKNVKLGWAGIKKKTGQATGKLKQQLRKLPRPGRKKQPTSSGAIIPLSNPARPRARSINGFPKRRNNQHKQRRSNRKMKRSSSPGIQIRSRKPMNIDNYY
uniref:Uncharacterized protein n=1 Tax=Bionectria ochroleuca TaxID=29856 RepID=A0A0B7K848_BIOOC